MACHYRGLSDGLRSQRSALYRSLPGPIMSRFCTGCTGYLQREQPDFLLEPGDFTTFGLSYSAPGLFMTTRCTRTGGCPVRLLHSRFARPAAGQGCNDETEIAIRQNALRFISESASNV